MKDAADPGDLGSWKCQFPCAIHMKIRICSVVQTAAGKLNIYTPLLKVSLHWELLYSRRVALRQYTFSLPLTSIVRHC